MGRRAPGLSRFSSSLSGERSPFPRVGFALTGSLTPVSEKQVSRRMPGELSGWRVVWKCGCAHAGWIALPCT